LSAGLGLAVVGSRAAWQELISSFQLLFKQDRIGIQVLYSGVLIGGNVHNGRERYHSTMAPPLIILLELFSSIQLLFRTKLHWVNNVECWNCKFPNVPCSVVLLSLKSSIWSFM